MVLFKWAGFPLCCAFLIVQFILIDNTCVSLLGHSEKGTSVCIATKNTDPDLCKKRYLLLKSGSSSFFFCQTAKSRLRCSHRGKRSSRLLLSFHRLATHYSCDYVAALESSRAFLAEQRLNNNVCTRKMGMNIHSEVHVSTGLCVNTRRNLRHPYL